MYIIYIVKQKIPPFTERFFKLHNHLHHPVHHSDDDRT
jgi:hypothetical protein